MGLTPSASRDWGPPQPDGHTTATRGRSPAVSRQVTALERADLIERRQDPEDHRVHVLHLTDAGRRILARVTESRRTAFRRRLAEWPPEDLERFAEYLERYNAWTAP